MAQKLNIVKSITPKNNAKDISTKDSIKIVFTDSMSKDELKKNIIVQEVNGEIIPTEQAYEGTIKTLTIKPLSLLPFNKKIEVLIKGGSEGIKTVFGDTLMNNISNFFTTEEEQESKAIVAPSDIKVIDNKGFISITFNKANATATSYKITNTNQLNSLNIYPDANEETTTNNRIQVPLKFEEGLYYLWMKNIYKEKDSIVESEYTMHQFEINKEEELPPLVTNISIVNSYPGQDSLITDISKFAVEFSDKVSNPDLTKCIKINKATESDFSSILFSSYIDVEILEQKENIVIFKAKDDSIEKSIKYRITLDKDIQNEAGAKLGLNKHIDFMVYPDKFYTSVKSVRVILGQFNDLFSDLDIMELIADISNATHSRLEKSPTYKAEEWEDGKCPYYVSEYVKYKTVYLLVLNNILKQASSQGKDIKLADLSVGEKNMASTELKNLLKLLKDELDKWEDILDNEAKQAKFAKSKKAVWAKENEFTTTYPDNVSRLPFKELGGN